MILFGGGLLVVAGVESVWLLCWVGLPLMVGLLFIV